MKTSELFEEVDDRLTGYINVQGLVKLLPDVNNTANFIEALDKLRLGQGANLTVPEKTQLALAFVSVVGLDPPHKTLVMRMLSSIQAVVPPNQTRPGAAPTNQLVQNVQQNSQAISTNTP